MTNETTQELRRNLRFWWRWLKGTRAYNLYDKTLGRVFRAVALVLYVLWDLSGQIPNSLPLTFFYIVVAIIQTYLHADSEVVSGFDAIASAYAFIEWWHLVSLFALCGIATTMRWPPFAKSTLTAPAIWYSLELLLLTSSGAIDPRGFLAATYVATLAFAIIILARNEHKRDQLVKHIRKTQHSVMALEKEIQTLKQGSNNERGGLN